KHTEYWVLVPGLLEGGRRIDKYIPGETTLEEDMGITGSVHPDLATPKIGDVYQKNDSEPIYQAMVVAIQGRTVYLGEGLKLQSEELTGTDEWSYILNAREQ